MKKKQFDYTELEKKEKHVFKEDMRTAIIAMFEDAKERTLDMVDRAYEINGWE